MTFYFLSDSFPLAYLLLSYLIECHSTNLVSLPLALNLMTTRGLQQGKALRITYPAPVQGSRFQRSSKVSVEDEGFFCRTPFALTAVVLPTTSLVPTRMQESRHLGSRAVTRYDLPSTLSVQGSRILTIEQGLRQKL